MRAWTDLKTVTHPKPLSS